MLVNMTVRPSVPPIVVEVAGGTDWWANSVGFLGAVITGVFAFVGLQVAERHFRRGIEEGRKAETINRLQQRADEATEILRGRLNDIALLIASVPDTYNADSSPEAWVDSAAERVDDATLERLAGLAVDTRVYAARLLDEPVAAALRDFASLLLRMGNVWRLYKSNRLDSRSEEEAARLVTLIQQAVIHSEVGAYMFEGYMTSEAVDSIVSWHDEVKIVLEATTLRPRPRQRREP